MFREGERLMELIGSTLATNLHNAEINYTELF